MWWIFLFKKKICSKVLYAHLSRVWRWSLSASQWQLCGTILCSWLMKCETAAVSAYVMCTSCNHAPDYSHFIWSHICSMHVWDLFHALVVTGGWNRCWNKSQHRKLALEKKILLLGFEPMTFWSWVWHSVIELSPLPAQILFIALGKPLKAQVIWLFSYPRELEHVILPVKLFVVCKLFIVELNNMWDKCEHFS